MATLRPARGGGSAAGRRRRRGSTSAGTTARALAEARPPSTCEPWWPTSATVRTVARAVAAGPGRTACARPGEGQSCAAAASTSSSSWSGPARHPAQRRRDEHLEGHHGAHRVARQREHRGLVARRATPKPCGLPGLHRHLVEGHRSPPRRQHLLDRVVGAGADPAGGDDRVGAQQLALEGLAEQARRRRAPRPTRKGTAPQLAQGRGEHDRVAVHDLPEARAGARLDQLVAGGQHHHPGLGHHGHPGDSDRGEQADLAGRRAACRPAAPRRRRARPRRRRARAGRRRPPGGWRPSPARRRSARP